MASPIEIVERYPKPKVVCGHCRHEILIDISPFKDNVAQIMKDNCVRCGGEIFVGILIMAHTDLNGLAHCVNTAVTAVNAQHTILGGNRQP